MYERGLRARVDRVRCVRRRLSNLPCLSTVPTAPHGEDVDEEHMLETTSGDR